MWTGRSILVVGLLVLVLSSGMVATASKMYWVDADTDRVQRANLDGSDVETLVTGDTSEFRDIALDVTAGKMYWADYRNDKIQRANLDGSGVVDIVSVTGKPSSIALDLAAGKMYWIENTGGFNDKIRRANLNGSSMQTLTTFSSGSLSGIDLDPVAGKMYWTIATSVGAEIQRANLDGSGIETVLAGCQYPRHIALDVEGGKMYWAGQGSHMIMRANLDGSSVQTLVAGLTSPWGIALDVAAGKMYWTDYGTDKIQRANLDGSGVQDLVTNGLSKTFGITLDIPSGLDPINVNITSPEDGTVVGYEIETIVIEADAWSASDSIVKVQFFADTNWIGTDYDGTDGWSVEWWGYSPGYHSLTAEATIDRGVTESSSPVGITILENDMVWLGVSPSTIDFAAYENASNPDDQIVHIRNMGIGTLNWVVDCDSLWLQTYPNSGSSTGEVDEVTLSANIMGLDAGEYTCELIVSDPSAANSPRIVTVNLVVNESLYVPGDYPTIQAAIDSAVDGEVVIVADGIYTGTGNRDVDFNGKAITVRSANGPTNCTINCQADPNEPHRGFYFHSVEDRNSILQGFTIINGNEEYGGGICCYGSSPTIKDCVISQNAGFAIIEAIEIEPGVYFYMYWGGGGGISCQLGSKAHIIHCNINNNSAYFGGGGIHCDDGNPSIENCEITDNDGGNRGGGIYCSASSPTIKNCMITGNTAIEYGGGIHSQSSYYNIKVINCTISDNSADWGGAIGLITNDATISNCILWGNSSSEIATTSTGTANVTYSNVQGGYSGVGNIDLNPEFVAPGNYHLSVTSPCIDSGNPNYSPAPEEWDIDGEQRVMNGRVDMGADEVSDMLADFDNNGSVDTSDLVIFAEGWLSTSGQEDWNEGCDTDDDGSLNVTDFLILSGSWLNESDTEAPSTTANLAVAGVTAETVSLTWDASTDNVAVAGYKVYRDGSYVGWNGGTSFTDEGLEPGTTYTYKVRAYDAAYNESPLSNLCQATTSE